MSQHLKSPPISTYLVSECWHTKMQIGLLSALILQANWLLSSIEPQILASTSRILVRRR